MATRTATGGASRPSISALLSVLVAALVGSAPIAVMLLAGGF